MIATESMDGQRAAGDLPRPLAWLVLAACAAAMLVVGLVATAAILAGAQPREVAIPGRFWIAAGAGAILTATSVGIRTFRWIFLLRRTGVRAPLRDATIGYLAGFSLLFVPLLVGEIVVRAALHRSRARVAPGMIAVVNVWERLLDFVALAAIAAAAAGALGSAQAAILPLTIVAVACTRSFRQVALLTVVTVTNAVVRRVSSNAPAVRAIDCAHLADHSVWIAALVSSIGAWLLPGTAFWMVAASWRGGLLLSQAQFAYAGSTLTGALTLAPGGVRIVGNALLAFLGASGLTAAEAALTVFVVRIVTAGLTVAVGAAVAWTHFRARPLASDSHFDDIAHAYDAQIPAAQREALLTRKTRLMHDAISRFGVGRRGLDVGCGQGWYVARMRGLGFDVDGIDASSAQVALARRNVTHSGAVREGSALQIPAADASYDFVYSINVLHHLASVGEQRAAFVELLRVLRPGGLVFLHEINTRNALFRFYMGYVFPSLNCIDEGTERWLLPHRLAAYTDAPVVATEYFTFMPEFAPSAALALFRPLERLLERSPLRVYSAHYMAVLQKPASPA
jgi:2-polyprenyl-3-methyl-5-hydroxy-6-metoxy-1,4-benzoquinol methylase/uncharacterized membrane protein YbhN (UPF0104 family)